MSTDFCKVSESGCMYVRYKDVWYALSDRISFPVGGGVHKNSLSPAFGETYKILIPVTLLLNKEPEQ